MSVNEPVNQPLRRDVPFSSAQAEEPAPPALRFADPAPLGLAAFALTTFCLSMANAGYVTGSAEVLGLALFYGGIAQFAAGLWEFANRNTFGATAFCTFGAFWMSFWYLSATKAGSEAGASGVGTFLLAFGIVTLYLTIASFKTNLATSAVFVLLTLTLFALAISNYTSSLPLAHIGGYLGILTALVAWYTSFAGVTNSTFKRVVIPVWPMN
jgi:succinate-acetate transporter protein